MKIRNTPKPVGFKPVHRFTEAQVLYAKLFQAAQIGRLKQAHKLVGKNGVATRATEGRMKVAFNGFPVFA